MAGFIVLLTGGRKNKPMAGSKELNWWKGTVIYQIYPRSFKDSNGDGVGDLLGIIEQLDYLKWLGVECLWLSPFYPSPMADFGYDISNYCAVDPIFGTMEDFDHLLKEVHTRNMKLMVDFVPNHSSSEHPWFQASKSSKADPKRDWYIWRDPAPDGGTPNNWLAMFGGSAWEWDEQSRQYYYHGFLSEQPDLNWRNPEVITAMLDAMRFWLDKGVDGFRVDVIWHLIKDAMFRDNPVNPKYKPDMATYNQLLPVFSTDQPEVHEVISQMRRLLDSYGEKVMIGEVYLPLERLMRYYGLSGDGAHMPFNFKLLETRWDPNAIGAAVEHYESLLPKDGWPNWVLGNHDQRRIASRVGKSQVGIAAMLLLTLRGTPTLYYGDEIGMEDVHIPKDEIRDPQGINMPDKNLSRDLARTPMQWDNRPFGGFSEVAPWLRVSADYDEVNVRKQTSNPESILSLYKQILSIRQSEPSLQIGDYRTVLITSQLLCYIREEQGNPAFLIILNFSNTDARFESRDSLAGDVFLSSQRQLDFAFFSNGFSVLANEGLIIKLKK